MSLFFKTRTMYNLFIHSFMSGFSICQLTLGKHLGKSNQFLLLSLEHFLYQLWEWILYMVGFQPFSKLPL